MKYHAAIDGKTYEIEVSKNGDGLVATVDGRETKVDFQRVRGAASWSLLVGDKSFALSFEPRPDGVAVTVASESYLVNVVDERTRTARAVSRGAGHGNGAKAVLSMMPGIVREVLVEPGQEVAAGVPLLILEAMKMENEIRAPLDGTVKKVHVTANQTVNKGDALVTLE